jgi:hypothetical protein
MLSHTSLGTRLDRRMGRSLGSVRSVFMESAIVVDGLDVGVDDLVMAQETGLYLQTRRRV